MSYGVALRNGVPFTLGTIAALCVNATTQWNPLSLWPDGIATPGMWISPRDLTSQWADYTGTTPVVTPGTVADSANPVGLALDIRAGATVLTDPGNHMLQSTSAARPLVSARVNKLTYTEDFSNAVWEKINGTTATATTVTLPAGAQISQYFTVGSGNYALGASLSGSGTVTIGIMTSGYALIANQVVVLSGTPSAISLNGVLAGTLVGFFISSVAGATVTPTSPRLNLGSTDLPYQAILTDGSSYLSTGFPIAQLYDGVDDGMATAAFAAGTLIDGMDCLIAVRRDSAKNVILGPYQGPADLSHYVGNAEAGYNAACYTGVGSPTVWVDNVQLINGWASELYTAVTVGDWHIVEFRGLDLSSWVGLGLGLFGIGYNLFGPRGDILLYPSTASTTDKDAARQWLADYYGVTLP